MPRPKSTDFLHNFRFHVRVATDDDADVLDSAGSKPDAGFSAVTTPEASHDAVEYREGHYIYTRKYPGLPTISEVTLSRGVALADSTFWRWMKDVIERGNEYRADLDIFHLHRDSKPQTASAPGDKTISEQEINVSGSDEGFIHYKCRQAFPIRHKVSTDLDATASEVSVKELELAIENFDVIHSGGE